ncbi:hypothetical protein L1887_23119 [Cichorium endivia]|nr:hypothetical protein L1887_23119 [Cichorium endivia]
MPFRSQQHLQVTSVILFLNILTSPFQFKDFASSLFEKQLTALILLIISVATMMVAFAATLILTVSNEATWSDMTLYGVSLFPASVWPEATGGKTDRRGRFCFQRDQAKSSQDDVSNGRLSKVSVRGNVLYKKCGKLHELISASNKAEANG